MHGSVRPGQMRHAAGVAALVVVSLGSVGLACLQLRGSFPSITAAKASAPSVPAWTVLPPGSYPLKPLQAGSLLPPLEAQGWLNGSPPQQDSRLVVLDIWSHWCMACRETAPGLVKLQKKYADDVSFVSLTNVDQQQVAAFADSAQIPWSCGYGASFEDLAQFGAYNPNRMSATYNPGYEIQPTIYLISAEGRVLWHDEQGRPRHLKLADEIVRDLEAEIERSLAAKS